MVIAYGRYAKLFPDYLSQSLLALLLSDGCRNPIILLSCDSS